MVVRELSVAQLIQQETDQMVRILFLEALLPLVEVVVETIIIQPIMLNLEVLVVVLELVRMEQLQELNHHKHNLVLRQDLFSMVMVVEKVQVQIKVEPVVALVEQLLVLLLVMEFNSQDSMEHLLEFLH
jgi:hypothetical protein